MHELSVIENIFTEINRIADENQLTKIKEVRLSVGRLRQMVPEMMQFAFEQVAKGTRAEGAVLLVTHIPITVQCKDCQSTFELEENIYACHKCQSPRLDILTGKEVVLESLSGDTEE